MINAVAERVTRADLLGAIVDTLCDVKAYELAGECDRLEVPSNPEAGDPFKSKRVYSRARLAKADLTQLTEIARRIIEDQGDEQLERLLGGLSARGVDGELKNLIFAADGPKPRIVLRDAVNNTVEIVEGAEHCLVYDRPLNQAGLTWGELVRWWNDSNPALSTSDDAARDLYRRLRRSLGSPPEITLFETYAQRYAGDEGAAVPALIPQIYLHFDPYTVRELQTFGQGPYLVRQRMDFLLLLSNSRRVVLEVDGKQHYSNADGTASPAKYADMVAEDRQLRLAGYEVFRFGGHELAKPNADEQLAAFFDGLLD